MATNQVTLLGRPTKELVKASGGNGYVRFNLAVDDSYTGRDGQRVNRAYFISCVAWGKMADYLCNYLADKGRVLISGKLTTNQYTGQDGQPRQTTEVVIEKADIVDFKPRPQANQQPVMQQPAVQPQVQVAPQPQPEPVAQAAVEQVDLSMAQDNLPFY